MVLAFEENVILLRESQSEALTDPLTGLGNRRRLLRDLERVTAEGERGQPQLVAIFDLDGFKAYNDSFGHLAGDVLLSRLGQKLSASVEPHGAAYRLGGDEFCVLAGLDRASPEAIAEAATLALREDGEAFSIGSSRGVVLLPQEAGDRGRGPPARRPPDVRREGDPPALGRAPDDRGADANAARARTGARNAPRGRGAAGRRARSLPRARRRGDGCRRAGRSAARRRQDGRPGRDHQEAGPAQRP